MLGLIIHKNNKTTIKKTLNFYLKILLNTLQPFLPFTFLSLSSSLTILLNKTILSVLKSFSLKPTSRQETFLASQKFLSLFPTLILSSNVCDMLGMMGWSKIPVTLNVSKVRWRTTSRCRWVSGDFLSSHGFSVSKNRLALCKVARIASIVL